MQQALDSKKQFITKYLTEVLGVSAETSQKDANSMVEYLSEETFEHMVAFFGYLHSCPMLEQSLIKNFTKYCIATETSEISASRPKLDEIHTEPHHPSSCVFQENPPRRLSDLKLGEKGTILRLVAQGAIRRRLIDMGILPDVTVETQSLAPLGDPIRIKIGSSFLSLRRSEADGILIKS